MARKSAKTRMGRRPAKRAAATRPRARERIVVTARNLFHRHGIHGVGVDAIAEAAGTNKMTLYRHFGSKDDLIVACLRKAASDAEIFWNELESAHPHDPLAQLHGWVRAAAHYVISQSRGCEMANAAVELAEARHPAMRVI